MGDIEGDRRRGRHRDIQTHDLTACGVRQVTWRTKRAPLVCVLLAFAIAACGSDHAATAGPQADLIASSVSELPCPFSCAPLRVEVCVVNSGGADAGAFTIGINGEDRVRIEGLAAGAEDCRDLQYFFGSSVTPDPANPDVLLASFEVDTYDEIQEVSESNNRRTFPQPEGTRCDVICGDGVPTPIPTPEPPARVG
jgi:hypothetical protein